MIFWKKKKISSVVLIYSIENIFDKVSTRKDLSDKNELAKTLRLAEARVWNSGCFESTQQDHQNFCK